jgi:uncharacterized protein (TIGR02246 family)
MSGVPGTRFLALIVALTVTSACKSPSSPRPAPISDTDKAAVRAADQAFEAAVRAGNTDAIAATYQEDAALLPPNMPAQKGRDAIRSSWAALLKDYVVDVESGTDALEGCGDLAYQVGHFRMHGTPKAKGGHPFTDEGKFLEVLKRQADGSWKYVADMYSSSLPLQH